VYIVHVRIIYSVRGYSFREVNNTRRIVFLGILAMAILLSPFLMVPAAAGVDGFIYDEWLNEDVPKAAIVPIAYEIDCSSYPAITTADCLNPDDPSPKPVSAPAVFVDYP